MRILFWGTPDFAVPSLRALVGEGHEVVGVVTRPDRPAGRGRKLRASSVREAADEEELRVLVPERPKGEEFLASLRELAPEISVVVAYGHLLVPEVLELPDRGSLNVHASLLPELRGAAPVNWALIRGMEETGVSIMQMTEGLDEGPVLLRRTLPIEPHDTATGLYLRLAELGAEALLETLALLEVDALEPESQDHARATWAPKVDRDTARVDWSRSARQVANHIRGMDMVPGAWSRLDGDPIKLFQPRVVGEADAGADPAEPGTVVSADPERGLQVTAGDGVVRILEVQPAGKRRMGADDWLRGGGPAVGDRLD